MTTGKRTVQLINEAVKAEWQHGNDTFGPFKDYADGCDVLMEEIDEAQKAATDFDMTCDIRAPFIEDYPDGRKENVLNAIDIIKSHALRTVEELIQTAAMCDKLSAYIETMPDEQEINNLVWYREHRKEG